MGSLWGLESSSRVWRSLCGLESSTRVWSCNAEGSAFMHYQLIYCSKDCSETVWNRLPTYSKSSIEEGWRNLVNKPELAVKFFDVYRLSQLQVKMCCKYFSQHMQVVRVYECTEVQNPWRGYSWPVMHMHTFCRKMADRTYGFQRRRAGFPQQSSFRENPTNF